MMTLYWAPQSRAGRMFWALEEVGATYDVARVDFRAEPPLHPEGFAQASPLRKVPALRDGALEMADSAAIALYLADRYAPGRLAPALDHPDRGAFLTWMFYTPSALEPAMVEKMADLPPHPQSYAWGNFDRALGAVEARLEGRDWLVGEDFSMADLMVSGTLQFMQIFGMLTPTARQAAWMERCFARPACAAGQAREAALSA
ncbi:glutathione S-transferase family protein [Pseudooceanicola sp. 200-1SW]|uniref:glutathione S-transferase family protein n=1 Tax=Pseudooceanicola sp. 200-1SW TaxID=3425949 RepID=UPI003D7F1FA5